MAADSALDATGKELTINSNEVWYFAYGANMSPTVLSSRRVAPRKSFRAEVVDDLLTLSFNHRGGEWIVGDSCKAYRQA